MNLRFLTNFILILFYAANCATTFEAFVDSKDSIYLSFMLLETICLKAQERSECSQDVVNLMLEYKQGTQETLFGEQFKPAEFDEISPITKSGLILQAASTDLSIMLNTDKLLLLKSIATRSYDELVLIADKNVEWGFKIRIRVEKFLSKTELFGIKITFDLKGEKHPLSKYQSEMGPFGEYTATSNPSIFKMSWGVADTEIYKFPDLSVQTETKTITAFITKYGLKKTLSENIVETDLIFDSRLAQVEFDKDGLRMKIDFRHNKFRNYSPVPIATDSKTACPPGICQGGGECFANKDPIGKFTKPFSCKCKPHYRGSRCQHKPQCQNCKLNKCQTDGKCTECLPGWEGDTCQTISCKGLNICFNGGKCKINTEDNTRKCVCSSSQNKFCETDSVTSIMDPFDDMPSSNAAKLSGESMTPLIAYLVTTAIIVVASIVLVVLKLMSKEK